MKLVNLESVKKRFTVMVFTMMLSFLSVFSTFNITAFAERSDVDSICTLQTGLTEVSYICAQANAVVGTDILVYSGSDGVLTFSNKEYSELEMQEKRDFMQTALAATKESSLGVQQQNKVYNFIAEQDNATSAAVKYLQSDASADFVAAKAWFRPFSGPVSTIMGVLCLVIFVMIAVSMLFDCAYLALPAFQALLEHGDEHKRPFGVSREAWHANKEVETDERHRNVMSIYAGKRIPVIIIMCLCLGYVISGTIYDIVVFCIDAFSSVNI